MVNIQFNNINKRYRRRSILDGVDIALRDGQCTLLCGANGAGKTTLLRIMAGLEKPDHGTMNTGLGEMKWGRCRRTLQEKAMYLHQHPYMFDASVRQNIAYALPRRSPPAEREKRIDEALDWADLKVLASVSATSLSGGEAQRVALARAWLRAPSVLLLDEPMANMDQESRLRTHALLRQLKDQGMAIVITSHDALQFQSLADRQLLLKDGKILTEIRQPLAENVSAFPVGQTTL
ncbi:MAG: ABC transporter ATP-binding protein, partial [Pseudomonadota bacterium]|nr:ABC transporter ATP-binding protein [Pseudomonadota bacterium]